MPFDECSAAMGFQIGFKSVEVVLILRNTSLMLKMATDNAILRNYAVSPENISERIKIQTENGFHLK